MKIGKKYFLATLALPVVIPVLFGITGTENALVAILITSLVFGGIPYLVLCAFVIVWARNRDEKQIRKLSYIVPLIFAAIFFVFLYAWMMIEKKGFPDFTEFSQVYALFGGYCLVIGYAYILVVNFVYELTLSKHEER